MERNYLKEILAFQSLIFYEPELLSSGQKLLWYALMDINNRSGWTVWFTAANLTLNTFTGLSRQGIANARDGLKKANLIDFKTNGTKATSYRMLEVPTPNSLQRNVTKQIKPSPSGQDTLQDDDACKVKPPETLQDSGQEEEQFNGTCKVKPSETLQESVQDSSTLSKQNKNKTKQNKDDRPTTKNKETWERFLNAYQFWEEVWGKPNSVAVDLIYRWTTDFGDELLRYAIFLAAEKNVSGKSAVNYLTTIFTRWSQAGIKTVEQAKTEREQHLNKLTK